MWNKFVGLVKLIINFGEGTKKNTDKIDSLEEKVQELTDGMTRMAYEIQRLRDSTKHFEENERNEREKAALRLEIDMLRFERRLPAPKPDEPDGG